jgi:hypothetical protein
MQVNIPKIDVIHPRRPGNAFLMAQFADVDSLAANKL